MKELLERPALKFVLRVLTGLCKSHGPTQELVAADSIPLVHRLEGISTEQWSGSLTESLMDALKGNASVAEKVNFNNKYTSTLYCRLNKFEKRRKRNVANRRC